MIKKKSLISFSHVAVQRRTSKNSFYSQIDHLIDWSLIDKELQKHYQRGKNAVGQSAYSGLLLFKMLLVGYWKGGLSDRVVELEANENLSVKRFVGLT